VIARYGTSEQQEKWLKPLLEGKIRSCFAMTEPDVASSDATNMEATIRYNLKCFDFFVIGLKMNAHSIDGDDVILNGRKWYISGATDPRCKVIIFMGRTHGDLTDVPAHQRHSMVLVPMDTPGS
jgi:acyl-CoA dehydrogenase